tara:strand:- start:2112 stop:2996 length:885 start_codon:yes stop_codon:yes gene_type:complete
MQDITLLVMAAGMGSRYGGLKQLDNVGPSGETIIDYSVYDAMRTGFCKVVFIIREDIEKEFKSKITDKYSGSIQVDFAFQDVNDLPKNFTAPLDREKPWGTGHAILSARGLINSPFIVINGDDFYGLDTYQVIYDYYKNGGNDFSMVAFQLGKTLSEFGSVKRGLCTVKNKQLQTVVETGDLEKSLTGIKSDRDIELNGSEPVSMNVWGFTPKIFTYLNSMFIDFLASNVEEPTSEFLIPTVVNSLISSNEEKVRVLNTESSWFGVTYKKDKDYVRKRLKRLVDDKVYPKKLFV